MLMQKTSTKNRSLISSSGAYFAAGELSRLGYVALVTIKNTKAIDMIASDGKKAVLLQVKTRRTKSPWRLSEKDESNHNGNLFYVFVDISEKVPRFYIIESQFVAKYIREHHNIWLTKLRKKGGQKHKHTTIRVFPENTRSVLTLSKLKKFDIRKHENKWKKLGLKADLSERKSDK